MSMEYVRRTYGVPARRGGRVSIRLNGAVVKGTITSATSRLHVRLDGEETPRVFHPTWELTYLRPHARGVLPTKSTTMSLTLLPNGKRWCIRHQTEACECTSDMPLPRAGRSFVLISGGQTGADQGGLWAGQRLGLSTGGVAPSRWKTEDGPLPELALLGLYEHHVPGYPSRTRANIDLSDATLVFGEPSEQGTALTVDYAQRRGKLVFCFAYEPANTKAIAREIRRQLRSIPSAYVLNIAGNRESKAPGIQKWVTEVLVEALRDFLNV